VRWVTTPGGGAEVFAYSELWYNGEEEHRLIETWPVEKVGRQRARSMNVVVEAVNGTSRGCRHRSGAEVLAVNAELS
jgi:hypothetical protein